MMRLTRSQSRNIWHCLPPEIILLIFEAFDDPPTISNARLTSKFFANQLLRVSEQFTILRLEGTRYHAARRFKRMIDFDLVKYVKKVIVCSSCYFGCATQNDIAACVGIYSGEQPETHIYLDPKDERLIEGLKWATWHFPNEMWHIFRFRAFLTYILRTISQHPNPTSSPSSVALGRNLKLELSVDQSSQNILDSIQQRYPFHLQRRRSPYDTRLSFSKSPKNRRIESANYILQLLGIAFSEVLQRVFVTNKRQFDGVLNLSQIGYTLRGVHCNSDHLGWLVSMKYWILEADYWEGVGREYQVEVSDVKVVGGIYHVGRVVCRRRHGKEFFNHDRVVWAAADRAKLL